MFELPGGYQPRSGAPIARSVTPGELNGAIELAVCEALESPSKPEAVSMVLSQLISRIGGNETNAEMMSELSVADRTYALMQLGLSFGYSHYWRSAVCQACDEQFDVSIDLAAIETGTRPETFPEMRLEASLGPLILRAPTGADQSAICDIDSDEQACLALLARCLRTEGGDDVDLQRLTKRDVDLIEAALDELALGIPLMATAACPNCGTENSVRFAADQWLSYFSGELLDHVHEIATSYHWSEAEILNLSRDRRLSYLRRLGVLGEDEWQ